MGTNRDGKVAVVEAVRARLDDSDGAVVTEYRGLTVAEMAGLRHALRAVGGDYKVYKNTLVRRAVEDSPHAPLTELLVGPTAIAFVQGDVSAVAKALRDFARGAPALIVKGGVLGGSLLDARELGALADLPSRDVLLAMFAGALAAPMRSMAGLLKAVPQSLAYGLAALLESRGGAPVEASAPLEDATEAPATEVPGTEAPGTEATETVDEPSADAVDAEATETTTQAPTDAEEAAPHAEAPVAAGDGEGAGDGAPSEEETAGA